MSVGDYLLPGKTSRTGNPDPPQAPSMRNKEKEEKRLEEANVSPFTLGEEHDSNQ